MPEDTFEADINRFIINVELGSKKLLHKLAGDVLTVVTLATPVGDPSKWERPQNKPKGYAGGRARGNWQISLHNPINGESGDIDPSGAPTIAKGRRMIERAELGELIVIQNNVPYIGVLNNGREDGAQHSFQAPIGFVQEAISTAQENFDPTQVL